MPNTDDESTMIYLTRKCEFSASHYYYNPALSEEQNRKLFGKCANRNGHGHNYTLEVTVRGGVDPVTGFLIDLKELKEIMNREVMDTLDHREHRGLHLAAPGSEAGRRQAASGAPLREPRSVRGFLR